MMIKFTKSLLVLSAVTVLLSGAFVGTAIAQTPEEPYLRLEERLEIGGTVLEPGVYMIKVVPGDHRDMLKITDEEGTKTFATVLTVPHATAATEEQKRTKYVSFPAADGSPRVLRTWFDPNSATGAGYDIVYPEMRAMKLAILVNGPVVAYPDETSAADLDTAELEVVTPDQEVTAYVPPEVAAPYEEEESVEVAQTRDLHSADRELPATASPMPLLVALGFLLLLAAGGVRILRPVQQ